MSDARTPTAPGTHTGGLSRVPYLPGLDGLRAVAVVGVMIYHANHTWLKGGFLGVEVFFVISGYLITLLLMAEDDKYGGISLRDFWMRRARRLLPALLVMTALVAVYIAVAFPDVREQARGDFMGGLLYVSNWYQILVGQGYASSEAFVPLRHLWSLAVEEQFYFLWPLVMVWILRRRRDRLPETGLTLIGISVAISVLMGVVFASGFVPLSCPTDVDSAHGYWHVLGRCISVNDTLYLSSVTRAGGLLLGAGFAMLWRPVAILRGPLRDKARIVDGLAAIGIVGLLFLMWWMFLLENGRYNAWLFRGGFLLTGVLTLLVVAAVTHTHAGTGPMLGNPVLLWIGTRSYGLYLYHWPIIQIIRKQAQIGLTVTEFLVAMVLTGLITEASYRFVETPIRKGRLRAMGSLLRADTRYLAAAGAVVLVLGGAVTSMALADPHCVGAVQCSLAVEETDPSTTLPITNSTPLPTVPGTATTVETTTTTSPPRPYVAIGESVMLGAKAQLESKGFVVQAKESRGPEGVKNAVIQLRDSGVLGSGTQLVIQVGTNAPVSDQQFDAIMTEVPKDVAGVVFLTVHAPVEWVPGNNERLLALPLRYSQIRIVDWDTESKKIELCPDGIHVTCSVEAVNGYADLILASVGLDRIG